MERISRAIYLIDDNEHPFSGWEFDNRGLEMKAKGMNAKFNFEKVNPEFDTLLKRKFRKQTAGVVTLEANFAVSCPNGFSLKLYDDKMHTAVGLFTENGQFVLCDDTYTGIFPKNSAGPDDGKNSFKAEINLDKKQYRVYVNNVSCGLHELPDGIENLHHISIGIEKGFTGTLYARGIKLYSEFVCNERFLAPFAETTPADWQIHCDNAEAGTKYSTDNTFSLEDRYYYEMTSFDGGSSVLSKKTDKLSGDRCFEIKFIESGGSLDTSFVLGADSDITLAADNGKLYLKDDSSKSRTEICTYPHEIWNTLRLEIGSGEITVRLNGKDKGVFKADFSDYTDEIIIISNSKNGKNTMGIDDILLFGLEPLPDDYVPVPVPAKTKGYNVGLHVCSLWRYGFWRGTHDATWDVCSAFDEITPLLGYYDEGIPEVADWETKWFCENGIDFQLQCWYGPSNITEPIKFPGFSYALHDAYFNSQYKKYSKFAVMWENNFTKTITPDAFKKYLVPYFIEYYFKDPGYYLIDNKPVFSIYSIATLITPDYFGSVETARECLDFMKEECRKAGFDGMILWCAGAGGGEKGIKLRESLGVDGSYAYNWGSNSYTSSYQENRIANTAETFVNNTDKLVHIPTVGVGFNAVARHDKRTPSISLDEYEKILAWTKDVYLKDTEIFKDQNSWQSKTLLLSCWNEFDEGHYINPSGLHGFGFLDKLRKIFTEEPPHCNEKPTESQKKRVNILYPEGHTWLRPERRLAAELTLPDDLTVTACYDFSDKEVFDKWNLCADADGKEHRNGCLCGYATGEDPQIVLNSDAYLPTSDINFIHVEMKTFDKHGNLIPEIGCLFYYTTTKVGWQLLGGRSVYNEKTGFTDVYMSAVGANGWYGDLLTLRFDPYEHFEIKKIEFLHSASTGLGLYVNGEFVLTEIPFEDVNDDKLTAFYSKSMLMNRLNLAYRWNRAQKKFVLLYRDSELEFNAESDICLYDGKEIKLPCAVKIIDGVPALPIKALCEILGYKCEISGTNIIITTN